MAMVFVEMDFSTKIRRDEFMVMAQREEEERVAVVVDVNESTKQPYRRGEFAVTGMMGRRALELMVEGLPTIAKPLIDGTAAMNNDTDDITPRFSMVERIIK